MRENAKRKMLLVLVQCSMAQHVLKNGRVAAMANCCKIISVLFSVLLPSSSDEMKSCTHNFRIIFCAFAEFVRRNEISHPTNLRVEFVLFKICTIEEHVG